MAIGSLASTSLGSHNLKRKMGQALDDVLEPLCHLMPWSLGHEYAGGLSFCLQQDVRFKTKTKVLQQDVRCETKTKDNVFVNVVASVQFRPMEIAVNAFYVLSNTRADIQANVFDVIRASVPKLNFDAAFEQKNDIARAIKDKLEKTPVVDIEPDSHAKKANNEINADADSSCGSNGNLYPVFWDSPSRYPHVKYHGKHRKIKAGSQDVSLEHENAMLKKQLKEEKSKSKAFLERIISLERMVKHLS